MYRVKHGGGRLALMALAPPLTVMDAKGAATELSKIFVQVSPQKIVVCTDVRSASAFAQDVIDVFIRMMRNDNPLLERSGILFTAGGSMGLQLVRILREAGLEERRLATSDRDRLVAWLGEALSPDERTSLVAFLDDR